MNRILSVLILLAMAFAGCEKDDPPAKFVADPSDAAGNLLIINNSNKRLVLYKEEVPIRKISSSSSDFLINIPNAAEGAVELSLYDYELVKDDINNPPTENVFKKWKVPLSKGTALSDQVTWHVGATNQDSNSGTLKLKYYSYSGSNGYNVDVYLNSQTGARIASLKPGDQDKQIGLDYGAYTLHYHYWSSDQNTASGIEDHGWMDNQTIDDEEVSFWVVLNAGRSESSIVVNHKGTDAGLVYYGKLNVKNNTNNPVNIWANGNLIEEVCYLVGGNTDALSLISGKGEYTYILPITTEDANATTYSLKATTLDGKFIQESDVEIVADETASWNVGE
ncbi:hypothetical protein DMA11_15385 [Marinilabiliaceae bacterium JC017]|nr:hypothetical protein DMA11_15385 [Marinilabiliaceae bacterium JC017]